MNRLSIFFIISVLFSHSAWAFHDIEIDHTHDKTYTQTAGQNADDDNSYDHCGHASSHLLALHSVSKLIVNIEANEDIVFEKNSTSSINYQPPVPPPIS